MMRLFYSVFVLAHDCCPPPSLTFSSTCLKREDLETSGLVTINDKFEFSLKMFISALINCLVLLYYYALLLFPSIYSLLKLKDPRTISTMQCLLL